MLKLRTILLSKIPYYIIFSLVILITIVRLLLPYNSYYSSRETVLIGKLIENKIDGDYLQIVVKEKEKVRGYYYFETIQEKENWLAHYKLGDKIKITGKLNKISGNTIPNLYSYQKNQNRHKIFFQMQITGYQKLQNNHNVFYTIKNKVENRLKKLPLTSHYVRAFLLGDKTKISDSVIESYQENGISHLLAISGMHVSFFSGVVLFILKKIGITEKTRYSITMLLLLFYLILTGCTASVLRATLFFFLFSINKIYYFYIEPLCLFILTLSLSLLYNPFFIYEVGFQFSFLISFFLIKFSNFINQNKNYFIQLFKVSILALCSSVPITLYHFS